MGLAASQARLLCLTARKADCEYHISINSVESMALTREMSDLAREYNARLQEKNLAFYANGKYNQINYQYLMGYGSNYAALALNKNMVKNNNSMILTDYKGQVVLSNDYAKAITDVLGSSAMNSDGRGGTFSLDNIPDILGKLMVDYDPEEIKNVMNGMTTPSSYDATGVNLTTGERTGSTTVDNSSKAASALENIISFYLPIFRAAATNGWTTEYNHEMNTNTDYVSDALISGTFQLAIVNEYGDYDDGTSLMYFLTAGYVEKNTSSEAREEVTAWYEAEKARINEKEEILEIENRDLSTELEAINTEIQSVQSLIDDATKSIFDWGNA